jgi:6-pyruvoyltetrahydropterin/6-carboxytetrahydropterin synthase
MRITKTFHFDSAHSLPNYSGLCANLHGHRWTLRVSVDGPIQPSSGMVIDFSNLTRLITPLIELFDHSLLNSLIFNPTAENILLYIADYITPKIPNWSVLELDESPGSICQLTRAEWETKS